jgi:putative transposase
MLKKHRPPHLYLKNSFYFITARTINKISYFDTNYKKQIFIEKLNEILKEFGFLCYAYVVLDNHYHILIKSSGNRAISSFINKLHSITSLQINRLDKTPGRKIWYQYWDRLARSETDFYIYFNYIHFNPIKHCYLEINQELFYNKDNRIYITEKSINSLIDILKKYEFSSLNQILKKKGNAWIKNIWLNNPIPLDFWQISN